MSVSTLAPVFGSRVLDTQALYEIVSGCIATHEERLADICAKACGTIHGSTMPSVPSSESTGGVTDFRPDP